MAPVISPFAVPPPAEGAGRGLEHSQAPTRVKPKGGPPVSLDEAMWRQARSMEAEAHAIVAGAGPTAPATPAAGATKAAPSTPPRPPSRRQSSAGSTHDKMDAILSILKEQRDDNEVKHHFEGFNNRYRRDAGVDKKLADLDDKVSDN